MQKSVIFPLLVALSAAVFLGSAAAQTFAPAGAARPTGGSPAAGAPAAAPAAGAPAAAAPAAAAAAQPTRGGTAVLNLTRGPGVAAPSTAAPTLGIPFSDPERLGLINSVRSANGLPLADSSALARPPIQLSPDSPAVGGNRLRFTADGVNFSQAQT